MTPPSTIFLGRPLLNRGCWCRSPPAFGDGILEKCVAGVGGRRVSVWLVGSEQRRQSSATMVLLATGVSTSMADAGREYLEENDMGKEAKKVVYEGGVGRVCRVIG